VRRCKATVTVGPLRGLITKIFDHQSRRMNDNSRLVEEIELEVICFSGNQLFTFSFSKVKGKSIKNAAAPVAALRWDPARVTD
jgi:hypothetical protein